MKEVDRNAFLLESALPYLKSIEADQRRFLGPCFLCTDKATMYSVTFKFTGQWEIGSCVKWM